VQKSGDQISYTHTPSTKLKLIRHICVLALIESNFKLSVNDFALDMHVPLKDARAHLVQVGCTVQSDSTEASDGKKKVTKTTAYLKAPLVIPEFTRRKKRSSTS